MPRAIVIPTEGDPYLDDLHHLEDYQRLVGGWTEAMPGVPWDATMFANEDGLMLNLPYNPVASIIVNRSIVGTVVLVGPADSEGDATDVPQQAVEALGAQSSA